MRRACLTVASWVGALGLVLVACGDGDRRTAEPASGGEAGERGGAPGAGGSTGGSNDGGDGATSTGGTSARGGSGSGGADAGGVSGAGARGGSSANGGSNGANGGTSAGSGTAGGGGAGGEGEPEVVICDRFSLYEAGVAIDRIRRSYELRTLTDCRLSWFYYLYIRPVNERHIFGTNFKDFSMALWGCVDPEPTSFALVYRPVPLSPAEAQTLIDIYVDLSKIEAELSPREVAFVERELARLAEPLIDPSLEDFSHSQCPDNGTGGEGGASAGAGGAPGGTAGLGDGGSLATFH